MVIRVGERIQDVKSLGNPPYPVNSAKIREIIYFLQLLEVKEG